MKGLGKLKEELDEIIETRTRDLPACSLAPKPSAVPRAPLSQTSDI
jgi:hypothetical protein